MDSDDDFIDTKRRKVEGGASETTDKESEKSQVVCSSVNMPETLMDIIPQESKYKYHGVTFSKVNMNKKFDTESFDAVFRVNLKSKAEAMTWMQDFFRTSNTFYNARTTYKENTPKLVFKKKFKCQHNTMPPATAIPSPKNTGCHSTVTVSVKNSAMPRSKDKLLKEYPTEISLSFTHNHPVLAAASLKYRKPASIVEEKLLGLFSNHLSASSALSVLKDELQDEYSNEYFLKAGDGFFTPKLQHCYYTFYKKFKQEYGEKIGQAMLDSLKTFVDKYNEKCVQECGEMGAKMLQIQNDQNDVVVAICSPLMRRVHKLVKASGEIAFVDSSGGVDRQGTRVFVIVTPTVAGGLPLGVLLTSSETEPVVTQALQLYQSMLPDYAFYGNGPSGGSIIFMTDDCDAERNSLHTVFPNATLLLCIFHVLQAVWRYVLDSKHGINEPTDRCEIFKKFKKLLYWEDAETFDEQCVNLLSDPLAKKYPKLEEYLISKLNSSQKWAVCFRLDKTCRGHHTNNYCESCMRIIKDKVLNRNRASSLVQLFDFLTAKLELYFIGRIGDMVSGNVTGQYISRFSIKESKLKPLTVEQISVEIFLVTNSESGGVYTVNVAIDYCDCDAGKSGAACKHLYAVVRKYKISCQQFFPVGDKELKLLFHKIMGAATDDLPAMWYNELNDNTEMMVSTNNQVTPVANFHCESEEVDNTLINIGHDENNMNGANVVEANVIERKKEIKEGLQEFVEFANRNVENRSDVYLPALEKFVKNFQKCKSSENRFLSACHNFGKECGVRPVRNGSRIPVSTMAVRRRKVPVGGRSVIHNGGRPTKASYKEHGYHKIDPKAFGRYDGFPKARGRAPHSITSVVELHGVR